MPPSNAEIAAAFHELADLMQIDGADRFRIQAYRRAGDAISIVGRPLAAMAEADISAVRGIGPGTGARVREYLATGSMAVLDRLRERYPPGVVEMTRLPGMGPKKAVAVHNALGVASLEELRGAIVAGRLREVAGFGPKGEENLLRALDRYSARDQRVPMIDALRIAGEALAMLQALPGVEQATYAGSLRRMRDTIGDLDILVSTESPGPILAAFPALPGFGGEAGEGGEAGAGSNAGMVAAGPTKVSVRTASGLQVDLRVVAPSQFGSALQYFTGSQSHNVKVRQHAVRMGLKLSEYGLFRGEERIAGETEEEVYAALGMQTPLPTMREDRGEVELALRNELPRVVMREDLRGDLQSHSTYSDGRRPLRDMSFAAAERGHEYFAVTDHGRNLSVVRSLSLEDIDRQAEEIRRINQELAGRMTLLHGLEANIGLEGELDYPDEVLAKFDVVVASLHHGLSMERAEMTKRVLRALAHPAVNVFGHPTARMLPRRPASDFDLEAACQAAADHGVAMELNASPRRLDLKDEHAVVAREAGCVFAISTDAHSISELDYLRFGIGTAQRAWLGPERIITTWPLERLRSFLAKR